MVWGGRTQFKIYIKEWEKEFKANAQRILDAAENIRTSAAYKLVEHLKFISPVGNPKLWDSKAPPSYTPGHYRDAWVMEINGSQRDKRSGQYISSTTNIGGGGVSVKAGVITIANTAEYALRIEEGWSQQAPQGVLRIGIAKWDRFVKEAQREVKI